MKVVARTDVMTHEEWLEARFEGIGGSDAGTILGTNPYKGRLELWLEKTGRVQSTFTGNEATELGSAFERPVAEIYAKRVAAEGLAVVAWPVLLQGKHKFQLANVDFLLCHVHEYNVHDFELGKVNNYYGDELPIGTRAILEIKTTGLSGRGNAQAWADNSVPASYRAQGAHYASVTGVHAVRFVCLIGGQGVVERIVHYTADELQTLEQAESVFWQQVTGDIEPEATSNDLDVLKTLYPESTEEVIEADDIVLGLYKEYKAQKQKADDAEEELKRLRAQIEQVIGSAQAVAYEGEILYTYKSNKASETFDSKAFKEAHPDLAAQFTKTKAGARVLRLVAE